MPEADKPVDKTVDKSPSIADVSKALESKLENLPTKTELTAIKQQLTDLNTKVETIKVGEPNVTKDNMRGFKHIGEFATVVMKACDPTNRSTLDERLASNVEKNASSPTGVSQQEGIQVGFLFPPAFVAGVRETMYEVDDLLSRVQNVPIDNSSESVTLTYVDDADRSSGYTRGGMYASWKSEVEQMSGTKPKLRQIKLEPQELYAFAYATDKSLRNAPLALGAWLQSGMQKSVSFKIGDSIVNGDGAGKPRGLLSSPDKVNVAKETSQVAATLNEANVAKMWKRMPAQWRSDAIWLANQDIEDQLDLFGRAAQGITATVNPAIDTVLYNREKNTLKGRPIVFSEYCQTLGTVGDFILWSPSHYLVATKSGETGAMSMHLRFDYAETAFRLIFEVDGKSEYNTVLTPYKGSTTRSAIVVLDTRT